MACALVWALPSASASAHALGLLGHRRSHSTKPSMSAALRWSALFSSIETMMRVHAETCTEWQEQREKEREKEASEGVPETGCVKLRPQSKTTTTKQGSHRDPSERESIVSSALHREGAGASLLYPRVTSEEKPATCRAYIRGEETTTMNRSCESRSVRMLSRRRRHLMK
ncbi:hypothetical protein BHE74_00021695, partial [Ensete ventricosum]